MKKVSKKEKMVTTKFEGQLRGDAAKEKWFDALRKETKVALPKIGVTSEISLPSKKLDGAFLSCLDGAGSLTVNGQKVSKMKVYSGEIALPVNYSLTLVINRVSDANCKLKAIIASK